MVDAVCCCLIGMAVVVVVRAAAALMLVNGDKDAGREHRTAPNRCPRAAGFDAANEIRVMPVVIFELFYMECVVSVAHSDTSLC